MSMFSQLIFKSLTVRRNRVAISVFSITIGAVIVTALALLYFDISQKMRKELRTYGANFIIAPDHDSNERIIPEQVLNEVISMVPKEAIHAFSPYVYGVVRLDQGNAVLAGVDFSGLKGLSPYWQIEGSWISVDFDDKNCMIGKVLADTMELKVGSIINMVNEITGARHTVKVKGIIESGQDADKQIFIGLPLAKKILKMEEGVNNVMLSLLADKVDIDALGLAMEEAHSEVDARPIRKISQSEGKVVDKIKGLMALVTALILATTTLCVMTTMMAIVTERTREIGLLKALGAQNSTVEKIFRVETLIMGSIGVVLGLVFGFVLAQFLGKMVFNSTISFRFIVVPITMGVSLFSALIASVIPVRQAVRIDPAKVLRGEE